MVLCKTLKKVSYLVLSKNSVAILHQSNLIPETVFPYVSLKFLSYIFHVGEKFFRQHVTLTEVKKKRESFSVVEQDSALPFICVEKA